MGGEKMTEYGDEEFIYAMAQMEKHDQDDEIPNDINNGYVVIEDTRIPFSECAIIKDRLYMTIPADFELMPLELAKVKYPNENRPHITFTNKDGSININYTLTKDKLKNEDVEEAKDYMQQVIVNPSFPENQGKQC